MVNNNDSYYKKRIVYTREDMANVNVINNIEYKEKDKWSYIMDIYSPNKRLKEIKLPAVIIVHGEPALKDTNKYVSMGQLIAASGLIAVTFNHRLLSEGYTVPEVASDIDSLINYLIKNAEALNIDKNKLAIWSVSAGVPFGLYAGIYNNHDNIKCNIVYYGFGNFNHVSQCFNIEIPDNIIKDYSPVNILSKNASRVAPLLIARAGNDRAVINESLDEFIMEALKNNISVDIYNHALGQHSFDILNDNERTHEIIKKTLEFLKKNLGK